MKQDFFPAEAFENNYNPYEMFQVKQDNCADYDCFAAFVAHYHGYETFLAYMLISTPWMEHDQAHLITIYKIDKDYAYSDYACYFDGFSSIDEVIDNYPWVRYNIYDYDMNLLETVSI